MPRAPALPEVQSGDVVGCFRVVRESYPMNGDQYYYVRCIRCGDERRKQRAMLFRAQSQDRCAHCPRTAAVPT